mgnify:CR=1 FL=1
MKNIVKILTALAAVAGAIYLVATYGERIVAWCRQIWSRMPQCPVCEEAEAVQETETEIPAETEMPEEAAAEEIAVEEVVEEAPEVVVAENEPVAAEEDFAE